MTQTIPQKAPLIPSDDTFGARLALIRQSRRWGNVAEAARQCGLPTDSWRNWEEGKEPRRLVAVASQIAGRANVDLDWLVFGPSRAQLQERAAHSTRERVRNPSERSTGGVGERVLVRRVGVVGRVRNRGSGRPSPTRPVAATRPTARASRPVSRVAVS